VSVRAELLGRTGQEAVTDGTDLCFQIDEERAVVKVMVTADGYQPHVTDPFEITRAGEHKVIVTLTRPFAEALTVQGRSTSLVGRADSASSGVVGARELSAYPLLSAGGVLEAVPGVALTQHSSGGHAPIVLLRGYNLDHGTDFATSLEGVPMNLPSHAHAQGYTDTNFLIGEPDRIPERPLFGEDWQLRHGRCGEHRAAGPGRAAVLADRERRRWVHQGSGGDIDRTGRESPLSSGR